MLSYWSYVLSLVGAVGYLLAVRGYITGVWMGLANQFFWAWWATQPNNSGFWFSVALFGPANLYALYKYYKNKGKEKDVDE